MGMVHRRTADGNRGFLILPTAPILAYFLAVVLVD